MQSLMARSAAQAAMAAHSEADKQATIQHIKETVEVFRKELTEFARRHKGALKTDPALRSAVVEMCDRVGIDPLVSRKKSAGWMGELLGLSDYYLELSVQIASLAVASRGVNGGLMDGETLLAGLRARRGPRDAGELGAEDVERAVKKLAVLGDGLRVMKIPSDSSSSSGKWFLVCVPVEFSRDQEVLLRLAERAGGRCGFRETGWSARERYERAGTELMQQGMCWVDGDLGSETGELWFPAFVPNAQWSLG